MATWTIDPIHSEVKFKVKHLVVATVTGNFQMFSGKLESEKEDFSDAKISLEVDVNSVTTHNEMRDGHLKTADFFDAANHPKMTFISKTVTKNSDGDLVVTGDLNLHGVSKEITLDVVYNGTIIGNGSVPTAGFDVTGKINRKDFAMTFNSFTEAGHLALGEEVKIEIGLEMHKQAATELKKAA